MDNDFEGDFRCDSKNCCDKTLSNKSDFFRVIAKIAHSEQYCRNDMNP